MCIRGNPFHTFLSEGEQVFVFGTAEVRAQGRHHIKVFYDKETQMSCVEVGDEQINLKVFLPTHKLSKLLIDAFEAQANDPHSIGHQSWLEERVGGDRGKLRVS